MDTQSQNWSETVIPGAANNDAISSFASGRKPLTILYFQIGYKVPINSYVSISKLGEQTLERPIEVGQLIHTCPKAYHVGNWGACMLISSLGTRLDDGSIKLRISSTVCLRNHTAFRFNIRADENTASTWSNLKETLQFATTEIDDNLGAFFFKKNRVAAAAAARQKAVAASVIANNTGSPPSNNMKAAGTNSHISTPAPLPATSDRSGTDNTCSKNIFIYVIFQNKNAMFSSKNPPIFFCFFLKNDYLVPSKGGLDVNASNNISQSSKSQTPQPSGAGRRKSHAPTFGVDASGADADSIKIMDAISAEAGYGGSKWNVVLNPQSYAYVFILKNPKIICK